MYPEENQASNSYNDLSRAKQAIFSQSGLSTQTEPLAPLSVALHSNLSASRGLLVQLQELRGRLFGFNSVNTLSHTLSEKSAEPQSAQEVVEATANNLRLADRTLSDIAGRL